MGKLVLAILAFLVLTGCAQPREDALDELQNGRLKTGQVERELVSTADFITDAQELLATPSPLTPEDQAAAAGALTTAQGHVSTALGVVTDIGSTLDKATGYVSKTENPTPWFAYILGKIFWILIMIGSVVIGGVILFYCWPWILAILSRIRAFRRSAPAPIPVNQEAEQVARLMAQLESRPTEDLQNAEDLRLLRESVAIWRTDPKFNSAWVRARKAQNS